MRKTTMAVTVAALLNAGNVLAGPSVEQQIEVLQQEIEALKSQMAKAATGNQASGIQALSDRTTIGGYGELHYNNFGGGATRKDEVDLHRFVLFFGHKFNDLVSFKSELEVEHAVSSKDDEGEVEVEQAYLDFHVNDKLNAKAGLFLIPMGLLNETHEPPTFFGVERNEIETRIIPSTWREAGVGAYGEIVPGFNYQLNLTSGFNAAKFEKPENGIRSTHQEGQLAAAEDLSVSGALNYVGVPGLLLGGAFFTGNTGQGESAIGDARLTLWDVHGRYHVGKLDVRALYARGHLDDAGKINTFLALPVNKGAPKEFFGWYTEAAYHVWQSGDMDFAPFVRYEKWDTHKEVPTGYTRNPAFENSVWTVGANFWPHPSVVLKADYQNFDKPDADKGDKRFNMGVGYMF